MKITLVMVTSVNGKITNGDNPDVTAWTSPEDQRHFRSTIDSHSLLIMGRKTFEAGAKRRKLTPGKLRVVMTSHPDNYKDQSVPGQVEFTDEKPQKLIRRLEKRGYNEALLVGGGQTNALFLKAGLVDELHLTIEPVIFPEGHPLVSPNPSPLPAKALLGLRSHFGEGGATAGIPLVLLDIRKLNPQGTLLATYALSQK